MKSLDSFFRRSSSLEESQLIDNRACFSNSNFCAPSTATRSPLENITLSKKSLQITLFPKLCSLSIKKLPLKWSWGFQMYFWLWVKYIVWFKTILGYLRFRELIPFEWTDHKESRGTDLSDRTLEVKQVSATFPDYPAPFHSPHPPIFPTGPRAFLTLAALGYTRVW